ncbi:MAG TPA: hypothetical protein VE287_09020 [Actinopolymorphaceae bacterium]|nr:hypothetical protein [Actinopolymorphaceae bacterium]
MPSSTPLPPELTKGPFLLADVRRWGLPDQIVRGRRFRRIFHGVYAPASMPDSLTLRVEAASLILGPSAVFCHHTAAQLRDLPVPAEPRLHVTVAPGRRRPRARGIVGHRTTITEATTWRGVRITTVERTFVDLARTLGLVDAVVLGDAMVRRGFTTVAKLVSASEGSSGRNAVLVRRAGRLVRQRVDSPMESRLRLLLVLAGLPCPEPGLEILDDHGQWVATADLQYERARIAIEYDSDLHRTRKRKWRHDVAGRDRLRELGWQVILVTADDIYVRPHRTLERVHDALRLRGGEGVPRFLDPRWREHFAPRGHITDHW